MLLLSLSLVSNSSHGAGAASGDDDKDGLSNLVEYALGKDPKLSSQPPVNFSGGMLTFTKGGAAAITNEDVNFAIETSPP